MKFKPGQRKSSSGRKGVRPARLLWTPTEIESAMTLFEDDFSFEDIARTLGRSVEAVKLRIHTEQYKARVADGYKRSTIAPEVEAERTERQLGNDARDITATFFGDPPRGFSALDKQRA
jgi:hypothetical protein